MAICTPFDPSGPYVSGILSYIDCQSVAVAQEGYRALGAGSNFAVALDGLIIIAVAIAGYRMVMGGPFVIRDAVQLVLRIGFVLALTMHWSAFQPLVYDVATRGPQDLLGKMFAGSDIGADDQSGMIGRIQAVDTVIGGVLHPEREFAAVTNAATATDTESPAPIAGQTPFGQTPELAPEVRETLGSADNILVISMVAGFAGLRIVIALMLALAPIFIAAALFDAARGFLAGWLRVLLGTLVASVAFPAVVALELAVIEPQVAELRKLFESGQALGALPERLWVTTGLFALVMIAAILAAMRAASAIRFPDALRGEFIWANEMRQMMPNGHNVAAPVRLLPPPERVHAQKTADAALAAERRDQREERQMQVFRIAGPRDVAALQRPENTRPVSVGFSSRDAGRRRSAAAGRRDLE